MIYKKILALLAVILTSFFQAEEMPVDFDVYATPQSTADSIVIDDFEIKTQEITTSNCGGVRIKGPKDLIEVYVSMYGASECKE